MLVSHKYRFIFIKTYKTAGTSIEVDLSKVMDDDDIVTPVIPPVDGHIARNYKRFWGNYYNHMPATKVRRYLGRECFDSYLKFTVEREPVSKCVSMYSMLRNSPDHGQSGEALTWKDYIAKGDLPDDHKKYTDKNGNLLVDRILKYENLSEELAALGDELGFRFETLKARAKAGFRETVEVDDEDRARIYAAFAPSLRHTGYTL